jgi:hypothetical protein
MTRKSLFAALGFLGVAIAGTAGASAPAAAHYGCGAWNNWCRPACGYWNNWCRYYKPGISFYFGYGKPYWGNYYQKPGYKYGNKYGYKQGYKHSYNKK